MRWILHVDMDAFFAAIEQRDQPNWRGKPVLVGAPPEERGTISTCSYEARKFGVHSAMPSRTAIRLCPEGILVRPHLEKYRRESAEIMRILSQYSPSMEVLSVDEAFIDVTAVQKLLGEARFIAQKIKDQIFRERHLTASVGVAPNKFLAKLASDFQKPDGLTIIDQENAVSFLNPLPVSKLWGVGNVTQKRLEQYGYHSIGDIQRQSLSSLRLVLGRQAEDLWNLAHGRDDRSIVTESESKSIGSEETFAKDTRDLRLLQQTLLDQAGEIACRLRSENLSARTVVLKLRFSDFETLQRQKSLSQSTQDEVAIFQWADSLLQKELKDPRSIRLIGVTTTQLVSATTQQLALFEQTQDKRRRLAEAVDQLRSKLGHEAVKRTL